MASLVRSILDRAAGRDSISARLAAALEVTVPDDELQARLDAVHAEAEQRKETRNA